MKSVKGTNKADESLTIFSAKGALTREEVLNFLDGFYKHVTPNLLCDFLDVDASKLTQDDLEQIIEFSKSNAHLRKNGKTAFVTTSGLSFGMARMYELLAEAEKHPIRIYVFNDKKKALTWLQTN